MSTKLTVADERWPLREPFRISRGTKTEAHVVVATIERGAHCGRGECVPYARYGESVDGVVHSIGNVCADIENGATRHDLLRLMKPGAARNAIDCALWDLESKEAGKRVWDLAGLPEPAPAITAYTIALDKPERMAAAARNANAPLLKIKLGGDNDLACVTAVREAAPTATLIVDPNEAWDFATLRALAPKLKELGVTLIEQPLPSAADGALESHEAPVPLCADEALHTAADLPRIAARYAAVNIKLDKTGGLTAALALARDAQEAGLSIMVGCMVATSLAMAPAFVLAGLAHVIDLDGPLLLAKDRAPGMRYEGSRIFAPSRDLWG